MLDEYKPSMEFEGIAYRYTPAALSALVAKSQGGKFGARDLRRVIRKAGGGGGGPVIMQTSSSEKPQCTGPIRNVTIDRPTVSRTKATERLIRLEREWK